MISAINSGNWSDGTIWSGGSSPSSSDDVDLNGHLVNPDVAITCISITNSVGGSGGIQAFGGMSITANLISTAGTLLDIGSSVSATLVGNISASGGSTCINVQSGSFLAMTGNIAATTAATGVAILAGGSANLAGIFSADSTAHAFTYVSGGAPLTLGSSSSTGIGAGTVPAASDVRTGVAVGSTTGTCAVPSAANVRSGVAVDATVGTCHVPAAGDTRFGAAVDATTGTCHVPAANTVLAGVAVDATTGTLVSLSITDVQTALTNQGYTTARAPKLDNLDATVGSRLAASGYTTPPTAAQNATAVELQIMDETDGRQVLTAIVNKINSVDADLSGLSIAAITAGVWAAATRTLTGSINLNLAQTNGGASVGTQLAHLDADVSGRLAAGNVTVGDLTQAALAKFITTDTGQTTPAAGSVAKLAGGSGGSLNGTGADLCTMLIADGAAVANASVWITSDSAGLTVVAGTKTTNSQGKVPFLLDHGVTYYLWMRKDGVNPILGQPFVAVAD